MFTPQNDHYKNIQRVSFLLLIFAIVLSILLIVMGVLAYNFKKLEEIAPEDIYITGIKSFTFTEESEQIEYKNNIPNLGNTNTIDFDCYKGYCRKEYKYNNYYSYINNNSFTTSYNFLFTKINENTKKDNNKNIKRKIISFNDDYDYDDDDDTYIGNELNYICSKECYEEQGKYCNSCPREYIRSKGECKTAYREKDYYSSELCFANHLILKWKGFLYSSENATTYKKYSYINSAILPNESCPVNTQLCGVLDDYGNKLCISKLDECPINKVVNSPPSDGYHYSSIDLNSISIYYTNEAIDTGIILEGLFVDSDYKIQYNKGCDKIDEGTIEELISDNREVYSKYKKKLV